MFDKVFPQNWMQLSREQRMHLAKVLDIPRSGISEVRDQEVLSDGHTVSDLGAITAEKMEAYVGSKESFPRLWELTIAKCRHELHPPVGVIASHPAPTPVINHAPIYEEKPQKAGKKSK